LTCGAIVGLLLVAASFLLAEVVASIVRELVVNG